MLAVVDAYEVITAARSYKRPTSTMKAREELARCAGSHFDPAIVRAFLAISLPRLHLGDGTAVVSRATAVHGRASRRRNQGGQRGRPGRRRCRRCGRRSHRPAPSSQPATQIAQPSRTIVATRPLPPVHVVPPAPQKRPAPHVFAIASAVTDPPPPFVQPVPAPPQAPVVPTPPAAAPVVTVTSGPVATSSATDATVTFDVSDPAASVTCSLDGAIPLPAAAVRGVPPMCRPAITP